MEPISIKLAFWPYYTNPYQDLFYGSGPDRLEAEPLPIDMAIEMLDRAAPDSVHCFHLHWLNSVVCRDVSRRDAWVAAREFAAKLARFKRGGGLLAWTIHNLESHDTPHRGPDRALAAYVGRASDIVLLHGHRAVADARSLFPGIAGKELIIPHGNYITTYESTLSRHKARQALGIPAASTVFLNLGALRPYKGLFELIAAAASLPLSKQPFHIVIAGRPSGVSRGELELAAAKLGVPLSCHAAEILPADMQKFLRAADWVVLPYQRILTSGSAILALSFGVPIVAPRLGLLPELLADESEALLYDANSAGGLRGALERALALPPAARRKMARAAARRALTLRWEDAREMFRERILATWKAGTAAPSPAAGSGPGRAPESAVARERWC